MAIDITIVSGLDTINLDDLLAEIDGIDVDNIITGLDQATYPGETLQQPTPALAAHNRSSASSLTNTSIHSHVLPTITTSATPPSLPPATTTPLQLPPPPATVTAGVIRRERQHPPRTDAHRFSRANLEESGDLELDAILGELCALGSQFDRELQQKPPDPTPPAVVTSTQHITVVPAVNNRMSGVGGRPQQVARDANKTKFEAINMDTDTPTVVRTDSPDNDSAFSDSVSVLSSESSASSGASHRGQQGGQLDHAAQVKAEKIKLALEKIKEANVKKLFLKAFSRDGSSKSLLVDEKMTVAHVTRLLADKNHVTMDPKWTIVEHLPDLYMERVYEDDEMLVENLLLWARDSKNKLFFLDRPDKYMLFWQPENYLGPQQSAPELPLEDDARNSMIEEFFSSGSIPEVEGPLFLKSEGKKAWKKFYFVLRASGLYYCPKGKSSRSSRDLVCLVTFENSQVYQGIGWRKKHKAPTDCGFAIKPSALQSKSSKYIKYLCTDEASIMYRWIMGIRIAKCGGRLLTNYRVLVEDLAQEDIDLLASSRSFSLASVAPPSGHGSQATTPSSESRSLDSCLASSVATSTGDSDRDDDCDSDGATPVNTLNRSQPPWSHSMESCDSPISSAAGIGEVNNSHFNTLASTTSTSSSSSSGCLSHRSNASTPSTEHGFESEFSQQGTIKRKPSAPKLPLTSATRHMLHEQGRDEDTTDSLPPLANSVSVNNKNNMNMGTLRLSLRRSITDDTSSINSLKRRNSSSSTLPRGFTNKLPGNSSNSNTLPHNSHSTLPSMPAPITKSAEVDGLPLPLPPPEMQTLDLDLLPPPPPELLASNLSLASSLPPPPDDISPPNQDEMTCSMISLPPPPPPLTLTLALSYCSPIHSPLTPPPIATKPKSPSSPPPVAPKPRRLSENLSPTLPLPPQPVLRPALLIPPNKPTAPKKKKISFRDDVQHIPPVVYSPSPESPSSPNKPPPPPRSESTRLSGSPQRIISANKLTPPRSFLTNLQKVMQRKWQVAEKCKDFDQNPHEVLGFRDSIPQTETERNVGLWIQEHYGCLYDHLGNTPNENVDNLPSPPLPSPPPLSPPLPSPPPHNDVLRPVSSMSIQSSLSNMSSQSAGSSRASQFSQGRKKPPPPLPKRSDSTHLSSGPGWQ